MKKNGTLIPVYLILVLLNAGGVAAAAGVSSPQTAPLVIIENNQNNSANDSDTIAAGFVQKLGDTVLFSLTPNNIPETQRAEQLRALFRADFDIQTIGHFVLGAHWRDASEDQRKEYFRLFEDMIVQTYSDRLTDDPLQSFKVTQVKPSEERSRDYIVNTRIVEKNDEEPINVAWRVRNENGQMKIVDAVADGISLSVTQRSDFDAVIQNGGGKVEALLDSLRRHKSSEQ